MGLAAFPLINQRCDLHTATSCPRRQCLCTKGAMGRNWALIIAALPCLHAAVNQQATHSGPFISGCEWIIWKPFQQLFRLLKIGCLQLQAPCSLLLLLNNSHQKNPAAWRALHSPDPPILLTFTSQQDISARALAYIPLF